MFGEIKRKGYSLLLLSRVNSLCNKYDRRAISIVDIFEIHRKIISPQAILETKFFFIVIWEGRKLKETPNSIKHTVLEHENKLRS